VAPADLFGLGARLVLPQHPNDLPVCGELLILGEISNSPHTRSRPRMVKVFVIWRCEGGLTSALEQPANTRPE